MSFTRLRRLRQNAKIRDLLSQIHLSAGDLIMPYFVIEGKHKKEPIKSMPDIYRLTLDNLTKDIKEVKSLGIKAVLLFGVYRKKDTLGSEAYRRDGLLQKVTKAIKQEIKDIIVITDVCLCGYTSHGHCGVVKRSPQSTVHSRQTKYKHGGLWTMDYGLIDNDATLRVLAKIALSHAQAGADFVAPSAMMDGQVQAIREALDKNGFKDVGIFAYSAKYASGFYGPFREALDSTPQFGDRKSYQLDFRNSTQALKEIEEDIQEGADIVMVKPALAYLDIIWRAKEKFNLPIAAYNVSGEYSMIKKLAEGDKIKEKDLAIEVLTSIKRAGADLIISYFAKEIGKWLG